MVTFKCKQSGNTVSFSNPQDIESMRKEVNYEEVKNEIKTESQSTSNHADDEIKHENERQERNDENEVRQEEVLDVAVKFAMERLLPAKEVKKRGRPSKK